jgi:hypothetical protein
MAPLLQKPGKTVADQNEFSTIHRGSGFFDKRRPSKENRAFVLFVQFIQRRQYGGGNMAVKNFDVIIVGSGVDGAFPCAVMGVD